MQEFYKLLDLNSIKKRKESFTTSIISDALISSIGANNSSPNGIPIRSIYLRPPHLLSDASLTTKRPSTSFSLNKRYQLNKWPALHPPPIVQERASSPPAPPAWTLLPTDVPLSPELRSEVRQNLIQSTHIHKMSEYRRFLKYSWLDAHLTIKNLIPQLEPRMLTTMYMYNKLTSFYWMPSVEYDRCNQRLLPFGCIFQEWFRYHDGEPNIEFRNFFAHFVRIYPTGPTTIQGVVEAHKSLCDQAALPLEAKARLEASEVCVRRRPETDNLKPTYRAIIILLDQFVYSNTTGHFKTPIKLEEHSKNQTILLVRTGDDSHLKAPVSFEALRANGSCLPLTRTDVSDASENVVRVSLADAVNFIASLEEKQDVVFPPPKTPLETLLDKERSAEQWADTQLKKADKVGIDNSIYTWSAVRQVKAARMGESFDEDELYQFNKYWI